MDSEPEFKATPEEIARITKTVLSSLAVDHVILPKEEFAELINDAVETTMKDMWDMTITAYDRAGEELGAILSTERHKGYKLGGEMLVRMRNVVTEEYKTVFSANHPQK